MATMRDVAAHAGVSIATVSFVVNNTKPVTGQTRKRIEEAITVLGYRRNAVARALASRRTRILALAYPALEHQLGGTAMEFVESAAAAASARDHHLILAPVGNDGAALADLLGQGLVDGVLLMEVQLEDPRLDVLRSSGTPYALIGRTAELDGVPHVDIDFDLTVEQAVDHLMRLGHRQIVMATGSQEQASFRSYGPWVRSEAAFRRVASERGIEPLIMVAEVTTTGGGVLADRLLADAPEVTAVIVMNEICALGLMVGLRQRRVRIPEDVSVMAMASAQMAAISDPPMTIMRTPGRQLGELGLDALVRQLDGDPPLPPQLVACPLEPGQTTARVRRRRIVLTDEPYVHPLR